MMKVLYIKADGLPLYKEPFEVSFYGTQRREKKHVDSTCRLFGNIFINCAEAFIGINASGKTTALKVISFVFCLLSGQPLNAPQVPKILADGSPAMIEVVFFAAGKIYRLRSQIIREKAANGSSTIRIVSEELYQRADLSRINKNNLLDLKAMTLSRKRENEEYLSDDVSIMIALNRETRDEIHFIDQTALTDFNFYMPNWGTVSQEIISLLDPTIERIDILEDGEKPKIILKFYGQKEMTLYDYGDLNRYLSSGAIKGIGVFTDAVRALQQGGYFIIDEIEDHFNRELVAALLRLFLNKTTNPHGAVIIFTTHYPELLDELDRNDPVFITRNRKGLTVDNLASLLKRNDLKKSDVYEADFLGGTAPAYRAVQAMRRSVISHMEQ
jgi:hypothetical protein